MKSRVARRVRAGLEAEGVFAGEEVERKGAGPAEFRVGVGLPVFWLAFA